jgi:hypothetical protein
MRSKTGLSAPTALARALSHPHHVVGVAAFALYLATLTRTPTGDSLMAALAIERGDFTSLFIPHRLLIQPLGWAFVQGWNALGWRGGSLLPLQVFSALGGAVAVALVFAIGRRLTGSPGVALLATIGFAVCTSAWAFSTDAEPVMQPLALCLLPLHGLLTAGPAPSRRRVLLLGLMVGCAMLTYHLSAFLVPALSVGLLRGERPGSRGGWARTGLFLGAVALSVAPVYLVAMVAVFGVSDWQAMQGWSLYDGLGESGAPYGHLAWTNGPYAAYGLLRSLIWFPLLRLDQSTTAYLAVAPWEQRAAFAAYCVAGLSIVAAPLVGLVARRHRMRVAGPAGASLVVWATLHFAFACWWVPGDLQFWVPVLVAWWLLVGTVVATPGRGGHGLTPRGGGQILRPWSVAVAVTVVIALVNGLGLIAPNLDAERDRRHLLATGVRAVVALDDLVLTSGLDTLPLYLQYFSPRPVIDVHKELTSGQGQTVEEVLAGIDRQVMAARAAGRRVFIIDLALVGATGPATEGTGRSMWQTDQKSGGARTYLAALPTRQVWEHGGETIAEVIPTSTTAGPG